MDTLENQIKRAARLLFILGIFIVIVGLFGCANRTNSDGCVFNNITIDNTDNTIVS